jgi:hypothetical protein
VVVRGLRVAEHFPAASARSRLRRRAGCRGVAEGAGRGFKSDPGISCRMFATSRTGTSIHPSAARVEKEGVARQLAAER